MNPKAKRLMYSFDEQLKLGQKYERMLDRHFARNFDIEPVTMADERAGIDRYFTDKRNGNRYAIQYKADKTAARTGNAFVETISVDTEHKPGWAISCAADYIVYYIVDSGPAYVIEPSKIKARVEGWEAQYQTRRIPNKGYHTVGILVPLDEFERLAYKVVNI